MKRMPWEISRDMFLAESEIRALLEHLRTRAGVVAGKAGLGHVLDRVIIEVLLFTGLRNSELCKLCLGDFDPAKRTLHVHGTGHDERTVYIPTVLGGLLSHWVRDWRPQLLPSGIDAADEKQSLVFNERRKPYERTGLYRRVNRILAEAGLSDRASVQLLRHTYGYLAYKQTGGNLLFVQRQLGHAHPMITSVYARLVDEAYDEMADRLYLGSPSAMAVNTTHEGAST